MDYPKLSFFDLANHQMKERPRFKMNLNSKILLIIVCVLLIGVLTSSILVLNLQRQQLIESSELAATHASGAIRASLEHAMLSSDFAMANIIAGSVINEGGIERVLVLNNQGTVRISSDRIEIGQQYFPNQVVCRSCHLNGGMATSMHAIYNSSTRGEVLLTVNPIRKEERCVQCHASEPEVLGLLLTETSLADLDNALVASAERIILSSIGTFVLMAGAIIFALRRFIIRPIDNLATGMSEVSSGNLGHQVPVIGDDELGNLGMAFNKMSLHLQELQTEATHSNRELSALYEVALATGHLESLDQTLRRVLEIVVDKLDMQTGLIYLWNDDQKRFERILSRGLSSQQLEEIDRRRQMDGGDLTGEIANLGTVHYVPDMSTSHHFRELFEDLSERAYINVPLKSKGKVVGTLELSTLPGHHLSQREIDVVKAVGYEIGIAIDNSALLAETQGNEKEATTLYEMGTQISASLDLDHVLNAIAEAARQVLTADIGVIGLVESDQQHIAVKAFAGTQSKALSQLRVSLKPELVSKLTLNQPVIVENWDESRSNDHHINEFAKSEGIVALLAVPLWRGGNLRGLVGIMSCHHRHFTTNQIRLLTRLAQQTSTAIENAQLYEQVQYVTVLEERERIAREIHDGLAQLVGSMRVWAEEAEMSLAERDWKASHRAIKKVEETARDAYASLREEMMGLRETFVPGKDIFSILTEYLSRFQREWGIQSRLQIRRHDNFNEPILLAPNVEIQLLRIVQEGLTNVHRHANARNVLLDCVESAEALSISIQDDGEGFSIEDIPEGHFGLRIMSERAASVGGQIQINSEFGQGTRLEINLPRKNFQSTRGSDQ